MPELELYVSQVAPTKEEVQSLVVNACKRAIGPMIQDEATKSNPNPLPDINDPRWEDVKSDSSRILDLLKRSPDVINMESLTSAVYTLLFPIFCFSFRFCNYFLHISFFNLKFSLS